MIPCTSFLTIAGFRDSTFTQGSSQGNSLRQTTTVSVNRTTLSYPRKRWVCTASTPGKQRAVLGIDVGTSATKAALCFIDQKGKLGPVSSVAHETFSNSSQEVTQRVDDWFHGALQTGREALATAQNDVDVVAIAVTGQMQDLIAVGSAPPALLQTEAILYSDARAQAAAATLSARVGSQIDATGILPKLTLLPKRTKGSGTSFKLLLGAADYIVHEFCVEKPTVTDATTASTTGLTRGKHRGYDSELLRLAGVEGFEELLPGILERPEVVGGVSKGVAEGLRRAGLEGTPVIHAGGDAFSATVGAGRGCAGGIYVYCGSSGWVGGSVGRDDMREAEDGVFALGHAADEGLEIRVGSVGAAGVNLSFAGATLLGGVDAGEVCRMAEGVEVGAGGLSYVPYLEGRRCPRPDVRLRGCVVGLSGARDGRAVARAVVEGVVFALAEAALAAGGGDGGGAEIGARGASRVRMVGGGARCHAVVRGVAALVGDGEVEVEGGSRAAAVGIVGAALTARHVVDARLPRDDQWWTPHRVVRVHAREKKSWQHAFRRWRKAVLAMETLL